MAGVRNVVFLGALLFASIAALAGDPTSQIEVKVFSGGAVVASALLPGDASIKITAGTILREKSIDMTNGRATTTATGHANLVAKQGGKEILTLNGEQLVVAELPQ